MILPTYSAFRTAFAVDPTILDAAGAPLWTTALLRTNAFASLTGIATPVAAFPVTVTCNGGAADGGAAFDWYLSQRTDVVAKQYLVIAQLSPAHSGSVVIWITALALSVLDIPAINSPINEEQLTHLFRDVTLYCQRRSDKSIQLAQLLHTTLG
jgi:hypothetical protein